MAEYAADNEKHYMKRLMKKAKGVINLMVGESEAYAEEDSGGDLRFDPAIMLKTDVTFDKEFLPKEKVLKLNIRGTRFFTDIKRDIREINVIYIVYPPAYEYQIDVRREEWEKKLISELNVDYQLNLKKIHFISEDKISRLYRRHGITTVQDPYNLKTGELLIVAGGFVNFRQEGKPFARVEVNLKPQTGSSPAGEKKYQSEYYGKYSEKAGAYFYVGGEWYYNLFVPEMYHPSAPRYFSFRIADDGKNLKFFSDLRKRGVDLWAETDIETEPEYEKIIHHMNPSYLDGSRIENLSLAIVYDIDEDVLEPGMSSNDTSIEASNSASMTTGTRPDIEPISQDSQKTGSSGKDDSQVWKATVEIAPGTAEHGDRPRATKKDNDSIERDIIVDPSGKIISTGDSTENSPYLESEMTLLPAPRKEDISSYILTIGEKQKSIQFFVSSTEKELSILVPGQEEEEQAYKGHIDDNIDYTVNLDSMTYSLSNTFLPRIKDRALKIYYGWELTSNTVETIHLDADFYILGRQPLELAVSAVKEDLTAERRLISLNKSDDDFWRIGASRDHALLLKDQKSNSYILYNLSFNYPVYIVKDEDFEQDTITPVCLEPVANENAADLDDILAQIGKGLPGNLLDLRDLLDGCASFAHLKNNDRLIIGSKVYRYIVPMVIESPLSDRARKSIMRTIHTNRSILRSI